MHGIEKRLEDQSLQLDFLRYYELVIALELLQEYIKLMNLLLTISAFYYELNFHHHFGHLDWSGTKNHMKVYANCSHYNLHNFYNLHHMLDSWQPHLLNYALLLVLYI